MFCPHVHLCEGVRSSEAGVTGSGESPCGCWELNPDPLEEQSVLLTAEPTLQPQVRRFIIRDLHLIGVVVSA